MMDPGAFDELAEDIKLNGLLTPIVTYEDKILDGRNREKACEKVGVEPRYVPYAGSTPLSYVISLNLKRRHLDESQRAMVVARIENLKEGRGRPRKNGSTELITAGRAAEMFSIGIEFVKRAKKVSTTRAPPVISCAWCASRRPKRELRSPRPCTTGF